VQDTIERSDSLVASDQLVHRQILPTTSTYDNDNLMNADDIIQTSLSSSLTISHNAVELVTEVVVDGSTVRCRKHSRNTAGWSAAVRSVNRDKGLSYVTRKGKVVNKKHPKPVNCNNCRFRCTSKFSPEERIDLCKYYYSIEHERKYEKAEKVEINNLYVLVL